MSKLSMYSSPRQTVRLCHVTMTTLLVFYSLLISGSIAVAPTPVIISAPHNQEAIESETVQFICIAGAGSSQDPDPAIIWWTASDNGTLEAIIVPTENISTIETTTLSLTKQVKSVLTLRNVLSSYSGAIVCQARNNHGADSALAMLKVLVPAKILAHPSNTTINVSDTGHMVCVAYGDPLPVLTWQTEDCEVDPLPPNTTHVTQDVRVVDGTPFVVSILEICGLEMTSFIDGDASVTYSCVATNNVTHGVAMETKQFTIYVQGYPIPLSGSHDLLAIVDEENYTISFDMSESGVNPLVSNISWMFVSVDGIEDSSVFSNGTFSLDGVSFTIGKVEFHHEGMYMITTSNGTATESTQESVNMDVQGAPRQYGTTKETVRVELASSAHLECVIVADPAPTVQWMFNDVPLLISNTHKYNVTMESIQSHGYVVTNTTLDVFDFQFQDVGNYSCHATNKHGNETSTFELQMQAVCPSTQSVIPRLSEDGMDVVLDWPAVEAGVNYSLPCPCGVNLSAIFEDGLHAYRYCGGEFNGRGQWREPIEGQCNLSSVGRMLCGITAAQLRDDVGWAIRRTCNISINSADKFEALDFVILSKVFDQLATNLLSKPNKTLAMVKKFLSIVDNILNVDPELISSKHKKSLAATRILRTIERVGRSIPIPENDTEQIISFQSFGVSVREVDPGDFQGQAFSVSLGGTKPLLGFNNQSTMSQSDSITLPEDIFEQIRTGSWNQSRIRIVHTVFLSDTLFVQRPTFENAAQVGSVIISASISGVDEVEGISDPPILITFTKKRIFQTENETTASCNYWEFDTDGDGFGEWSTRGCVLFSETKDTVVCACDHLTNFALLLDVSPKLGNNTMLPKELTKTLLAASYIGAIVSTLFLAITIATYSLSKKLRSTVNGKLLINLCTGFIGIYLMFIISYHSTRWDVPCAIAGALLHYFMLVTFAIMAAEAICLYIHLVVVLGCNTIKSYYTLKTTLIAWILPLIIVVVSIAPNYKNYIGEELCRPYGIPFYAALIAPFLLVYLFNWVVFILIIVSLIKNSKKRRNNMKMADGKKSSSSMFKRHLIITIGLSLFFGLGWGLGLPATNAISNVPLRVMLQILFIFFSGFQGVFIFIMQCARSEDARKEWARWVKVLTCGTVSVGKSGLGHSNANTYNRNSSNIRYNGATLPRTSNTMITQTSGSTDTLTRTVQPSHYNSHSNLLLYGSQSSLVMEDVKKTSGVAKDKCMTREEKNLDLSVVYENSFEEDLDGAESADHMNLEDCHDERNAFSNPLQFMKDLPEETQHNTETEV